RALDRGRLGLGSVQGNVLARRADGSQRAGRERPEVARRDRRVTDEPVVRFGSQKDWERWLAKNHDKLPAVWLEIAKKAATFTTVTYADAVESALCYGWIDGRMKSGGVEVVRQRFTPRGPRSRWSRINTENAMR